MVGIDMCYREVCEGGGCNNKFLVYDEFNMVTIDGQLVVGVKIGVIAECVCIVFINVRFCIFDYCQNGGTCQINDWDVIRYRFGFVGYFYCIYVKVYNVI